MKEFAQRELLSNSMKSSAGNTFHQWGGRIALFFSYTHLSHDMTTGLLGALLPFIRQDLGLNYMQSGLLVSAYALTAGFSQVLGGIVGDRLSRQKTIALGLGGVGLCAIAIGLTSSYYALLGILIVMGVLSGAYHPSAVSTITSYFEKERRGKAIALHMVGGSFGFGIAPFVGAAISSALNWHYAFIFLCLPALVAVPLVLTQLKLPAKSAEAVSMAAQSVSTAESDHGLSAMSRVFRNVAGVVVIVLIVHLVIGPAMSFFPLYLVDKHNLSTAAASSWMTVLRIGGVAGSLFGGWLADKWGRKRAIFATLVALGPVFFLLTWFPFNAALIVDFIVFGMLGTMREATTQAYLMDSTPTAVRATVFGIYFGVGQEGSSLIQPVVGHYMDIVGIESVFTVTALITIALSVTAIFLARKA